MSTATAPLTNSPADVLAWHDDIIRRCDFELIGRVWVIVLEAAAGVTPPQRSVTDALGLRMEFFGYDQKGAPLKPRIAQTRDKQSLLLLDPIVRADGKVGLPDIPDPSWTPGQPRPEQVCWSPKRDRKGKVIPGQKAPAMWNPQPPMIQQDLGSRARGQLRGTRYLVFGPVAQILVHPEGIATGWTLECGGELHSGHSMEMLINQDTGQAFLFGGRFQIRRF